MAGGRIGLSGWDTGNGDGLIAKLSTADLSYEWGGVYYTGSGPTEVCHHSVHGIASTDDTLYVMGQVYTGNLNFFRYWGYWYDYPETAAEFAASSTDVVSETTIVDMGNAGFVTDSDSGFSNDGVFEPIEASMNVEYLDAPDKNEETTAGNTDGDVFVMKLAL